MEWINDMFEKQLQWYYDSAMFYINGRDIYWFIVGFVACITFTYFVQMMKYLIEERKEK